MWHVHVWFYSSSRKNKEVNENFSKIDGTGDVEDNSGRGMLGPKGYIGAGKRGVSGVGGGEISQKEIGMSWFLSCCCGKIP